ncbi:hypothetical protein ACFQ3K_04035 [Brucella gallinifaecis]|uniref:hypothetical protein n=1 Tax=Brucella gallinifaecis TaxID=215590 RepID=UPI00130ED78D|nr:hypothetical protein [Brucella gallinifaecis]
MEVPEADYSPGFISVFNSFNINLEEMIRQIFCSSAFSMPPFQHAQAALKGQAVVC